MEKSNRIRWISALGTLAVLSLALGFPSSQAESRNIVRGPRKVEVSTVAWSQGKARFRAHGFVKARDRAALSFTVPGRLVTRPVRVGDRVAKGALLGRIDPRGYDHGARAAAASARQAKAQLAMNEIDRDRLASLEAARAISRDQVEHIGTAVDAARATRDAAEVQLREARRTLRETELRAPFSGVVVAVMLEPGEFASPGHPVIILSGDAGLEIEIDVPGRIADRLEVGQGGVARFPLDSDAAATARIVTVADSAAGPGRLFPVLLALEPGTASEVRPGSAAEVTFEVGVPRELTVPAGAIVAPAGVDAAVFRLRGGAAERVPVALGALHGTHVAVAGDIREGEQVIVAGYTGLVPGEPVEVAP